MYIIALMHKEAKVVKYSDIYDACKQLNLNRKIQTFVDLGARHGESYEKFGKDANIDRYVFVEPSDRCIDHIKKIVEIDGKKFQLIEGVLGSKDSEADFYQLEHDNDQSGNLFSDRRSQYGSAIIKKVKVYDFRKLFSSNIDFVKCNIEGAEYQLIKDGFFDLVESFVMEVHNQHVPGKNYMNVILDLSDKFNLEIWGNVNYKYCFINGRKKNK